MQSFLIRVLRGRPVILAGLGLLVISACASEPAQLGTPEYALARLFGDRPYRSTDQLLAAQQSRPAKPASAPAAATAGGEATDGGVVTADSGAGAVADAETPTVLKGGSTPGIPAAVTIIETNEWEGFSAGGAYGFPYPYYHDPRPYRPFYHQLYGPGGYRRCFGGCGGLAVSIGSNPGFRLNAGAGRSSSTSTVIAQPPFLYRSPVIGPPAVGRR